MPLNQLVIEKRQENEIKTVWIAHPANQHVSKHTSMDKGRLLLLLTAAAAAAVGCSATARCVDSSYMRVAWEHDNRRSSALLSSNEGNDGRVIASDTLRGVWPLRFPTARHPRNNGHELSSKIKPRPLFFFSFLDFGRSLHFGRRILRPTWMQRANFDLVRLKSRPVCHKYIVNVIYLLRSRLLYALDFWFAWQCDGRPLSSPHAINPVGNRRPWQDEFTYCKRDLSVCAS